MVAIGAKCILTVCGKVAQLQYNCLSSTLEQLTVQAEPLNGQFCQVYSWAVLSTLSSSWQCQLHIVQILSS